MPECKCQYKIKIRYEEFLTHPVLTAAFVVLFFSLSFARLPPVLYMLMLAVEIYIAMFFGARFASADYQEQTSASPAENSSER